MFAGDAMEKYNMVMQELPWQIARRGWLNKEEAAGNLLATIAEGQVKEGLEQASGRVRDALSPPAGEGT